MNSSASPHYARLRPDVGPLSGASVIVTRPSGTSRALLRRVNALGGIAFQLPAIVLRKSADSAAARLALRGARDADMVVFSSPAAVRFAFALWPALRFTRAVQACAMGAATARALQRRGVREVLHPLRQDSEGLLALPAFARLRGRRIALVGAPGGRELLPQSLKTRGARVERVHVYERVVPRFSARRLATLAELSPPLVTLASSADALVNLRAALPESLFARLCTGELVVSSARLAAAAHVHGFANVHVAASAAPRDLVEAAQFALARHRL
jgi:uroporphyrinogen-III synthase